MAWVVTAVAAAFEVGATAAVIATAVTEVGIATSVVGLVTGNKDLMKIGGFMSMAGGIGGLAAGAIDGAATAGISTASDLSGNVASGAAADGAMSSAVDSAVSGAADSASAFGVDAAPGMTSDGIVGSQLGVNSPPPSAGSAQPGIGIGSGAQPSMAPTGAPAAAPDATSTIPYSGAGPSNFGTSPDVGQPGGLGSGLSDAGANNILNDGMPGPQALQTPSGVVNNSGSIIDQLKAKFGAAWNGMSANAQAEVVKAAMAVPGGIQTQQNKERELALQQQKVNQTSYGSQVPVFGIINSAKKG